MVALPWPGRECSVGLPHQGSRKHKLFLRLTVYVACSPIHYILIMPCFITLYTLLRTNFALLLKA